MSQTIEDLVDKQEARIADFRRRIIGVDAVLARASEEKNALLADILMAQGKLEGLKEALSLQSQPSREAHSGESRGTSDSGQTKASE